MNNKLEKLQQLERIYKTTVLCQLNKNKELPIQKNVQIENLFTEIRTDIKNLYQSNNKKL